MLLTGMSGTGKSTVIDRLSAQGYKAIDLDYGGWTEVRSHPDGEETLWLEDRVAGLLRRSTVSERKGAAMAVAVQIDFPGATLDQYDQVIEKMGLKPRGPGAAGGISRSTRCPVETRCDVLRTSLVSTRTWPFSISRASALLL